MSVPSVQTCRLHHRSHFLPPESSSSSWQGHCQILSHCIANWTAVIVTVCNLMITFERKSACIALTLALSISIVFFNSSSISKMSLPRALHVLLSQPRKSQSDTTLWCFYTGTVISHHFTYLYLSCVSSNMAVMTLYLCQIHVDMKRSLPKYDFPQILDIAINIYFTIP